MTFARIADACRRREPLGIVVARQSGSFEVGPEAELKLQLCRVAAEQKPFEEDRAVCVRACGLVVEAEMLRMPRRFARDRLADVRVDLRQRVIAPDPPERVRKPRVAARVMQG